jgi:hypothetical protein
MAETQRERVDVAEAVRRDAVETSQRAEQRAQTAEERTEQLQARLDELTGDDA